MGFFPEGTRSLDGELQEAKSGIGMIAYQSQVAILPVYIHGSFKAFPKGAKFFKPIKIHVYFGQPYVPTAYQEPKSREVYQLISDETILKIKEIQQQVRNG